MTDVYLDSNIFIYLADKLSLYYSACAKLISLLDKNNFQVVTSVETIQEIVHYSQRINKYKMGLRIALKIIKMVNQLLPVDIEVIESYLTLVNKYKNFDSRDILHLAVSIKYKIPVIVSYDKDFRKFKEIQAMTAEEFILFYGQKLRT